MGTYKDHTGKKLPEGVVRFEWRDQYGHVIEMPDINDRDYVQKRKEIFAKYNGLVYRYAVREGARPAKQEGE